MGWMWAEAKVRLATLYLKLIFNKNEIFYNFIISAKELTVQFHILAGDSYICFAITKSQGNKYILV